MGFIDGALSYTCHMHGDMADMATRLVMRRGHCRDEQGRLDI